MASNKHVTGDLIVVDQKLIFCINHLGNESKTYYGLCDGIFVWFDDNNKVVWNMSMAALKYVHRR
jgi:hypothetical protein